MLTWKNPTRLGAGLRPPTWCFLSSPLWRNKLGKRIEEVELALRHPDIRITKIPDKTSRHNPNGELLAVARGDRKEINAAG